jgi:hypothetical protein
MNKSIENIWKTGFSKEAIEVPKIYQFYNQKSISAVEETIKQFKREVHLLIPLSILVFLFNVFLDNSNALFWATISTVPSLVWFLIGRKQVKDIASIDYKTNCYDYLTSLRAKLSSIRTFNKRLGISSIPILLFPMITYTYFNQRGKTIGEIFGVDGIDLPTGTIFLLIPIMTLAAYFVAEVAFRRRRMSKTNKIDSLIQDMEKLRA